MLKNGRMVYMAWPLDTGPRGERSWHRITCGLRSLVDLFGLGFVLTYSL